MDAMTFALIAVGLISPVLFGICLVGLRKAWSGGNACRSKLADTQLELREAQVQVRQVEELKADLKNTRAKHDQAERALAEALTRAERVEELETRLEQAQQTEATRRSELEALKATLDEREAAVTDERARLTALGQEMQDRFKALADEALDASSKKLLEQARKSFEAQHETTQGGVKSLVDPIREQLGQFRQQVEQFGRDRMQNEGKFFENITMLNQGLSNQHRETAKLVNALQGKSTTRGQWGERTVENILELAGLTKGIDYDAQHQTRDSEGAVLRPDFVIKLPGGGRFVVDSKVALTAYLDVVEAEDETVRRDALRRHASQVKTHVKQLAKKDYAVSVAGAINFVALFMPGEHFCSAAIEEDPDLFDEALKANVIITTPFNLLALAKTVAYGFRQERLEHNAKTIAALGDELHDRIRIFSRHMTAVGSGLRNATNKYNDAVGSFERRVMPQARKMADLNGQTRQIEAPTPVDETPRAINAADVTDQTMVGRAQED